MNLLFVNPTFRKWGGVEEVIVLLADHFRSRGHRIVIASEDTLGTLQNRFSPLDLHYGLALKQKTPWTAAANFLHLLRIGRRERIDLIHSHQKKTTVLCVAVGRLLGIPVVHTHHNPLADWRARWFAFLGQHVVANSAAARDNLIRVFGVDAKRISVIYDAPRFMPVPAPEEVARVRTEFGLVPAQPVLVCLARLTDEKGHAVLLQAMTAIRAEFPGVRLLVVGKGHLRQRLEEQAAALGLTSCVAFTGYREDANALVCAADLAVHPSLRDAFPLTNIECLRLGVPVVSTAVDGIPELIRDGDNGVLVPPGDAGALAVAVSGALRNPARMQALAQKGRADALARFDPTVMCEQYEAYFAALVKPRSRRRTEPAARRSVGAQGA
jgi:glycosyltransferase involved in cell wall biosynthesis